MGTPIETADFIYSFCDERLKEEQRFLNKLEKIDDLQCAWLLLSYCGVPRANHLLWVVSPSLILSYARQHDDMIWSCFCNICKCCSFAEDDIGRDIASLPTRMGGLGLRSAVRTSPGAYWAACGDALEIIKQKLPILHQSIMYQLNNISEASCLTDLLSARQILQNCGINPLPSWEELSSGISLTDFIDGDAGEWKCGWQFHANKDEICPRLCPDTAFSPTAEVSRRCHLKFRRRAGLDPDNPLNLYSHRLTP